MLGSQSCQKLCSFPYAWCSDPEAEKSGCSTPNLAYLCRSKGKGISSSSRSLWFFFLKSYLKWPFDGSLSLWNLQRSQWPSVNRIGMDCHCQLPPSCLLLRDVSAPAPGWGLGVRGEGSGNARVFSHCSVSAPTEKQHVTSEHLHRIKLIYQDNTAGSPHRTVSLASVLCSLHPVPSLHE